MPQGQEAQKKIDPLLIIRVFSVERTQPLKGSMEETAKSSKSSTTSRDAEDRAPKIIVWHAASSHFQRVVSYNTYHILDRSQTCNGKTAARTSKYAKRMETLVKAYTFVEKNPITILSFLAQSKQACDSDGVS